MPMPPPTCRPLSRDLINNTLHIWQFYALSPVHEADPQIFSAGIVRPATSKAKRIRLVAQSDKRRAPPRSTMAEVSSTNSQLRRRSQSVRRAPSAASPHHDGVPVDRPPNAQDRACVLQRPTQMRCEKPKDLGVRDREKNRVRRGYLITAIRSFACRMETAYPSSPNRALTATAASDIHGLISIMSRFQCRGARRCARPPSGRSRSIRRRWSDPP